MFHFHFITLCLTYRWNRNVLFRKVERRHFHIQNACFCWVFCFFLFFLKSTCSLCLQFHSADVMQPKANLVKYPLQDLIRPVYGWRRQRVKEDYMWLLVQLFSLPPSLQTLSSFHCWLLAQCCHWFFRMSGAVVQTRARCLFFFFFFVKPLPGKWLLTQSSVSSIVCFLLSSPFLVTKAVLHSEYSLPLESGKTFYRTIIIPVYP